MVLSNHSILTKPHQFSFLPKPNLKNLFNLVFAGIEYFYYVSGMKQIGFFFHFEFAV